MYFKMFHAVAIWFLIPQVLAYPQHHHAPSHDTKFQYDEKIPEPPTEPPLVEKSVVEMVQPKLLCPKNFHIFKDKCVQLVKRPVDFRCTKGYELLETEEHVECVKSTLEEPELVCGQGFTPSGEVCMRLLDTMPEYRCPPHFILRNRKCVSTKTSPPAVSCPAGYRMVNNECVRLVKVEPTFYCDGDGFQLDREILRCVGTDWRPVEFVCPAGAIPQGGSCMKTQQLPAQPACPEGSTQEGDKCVTEDVIEVTSVCDGSSPSDQDENCIVEQVLPAQMRCPSGYDLNPETGSCAKLVEAPLEPVCLEGIVDRSVNPPVCKFAQSTLPALLCPEGYTKEEEGCVKRTEVPVQPTCKDGFSFTGDSCEKSVPTTTIPYCPNGYEMSGDTCVKPSFQNAQKMCPPGYEFEYGMCSAMEQTAPQHLCNTGYVYEKGHCVPTTFQEPEAFCNCSQCELKEDKCITREVQHPNMVCKEPYQFNAKNGMCELGEKKHPDAYCPPGFKFKGNGKAPGKARCTMTETIDPKASCDKGYQYDPERGVCRSGAHVKHVTMEAADGKTGGSHHTAAHHNTKPESLLYR
eukprot:Selendium_serpulae@DN6231_c4_g1_i1.p1